MGPYQALIDVAFQQLLHAKSADDRRLAGKHFTDLIRLRNAQRTPEEIARLERAKGLR